ncbi:LysR family transcriptional regulator [Paucibacter sp. O1-1]|nr:LysR family transcriptional regulator [Paucibacter sp. O1-1]MDA3825692.1 LysR family transcriptional regulator [Paucibacter sp. O1-1]
MDRLAAMQAFVRVVQLTNFSRAAEALRLPNPTVTRLVQNLESHLHTKLLNRTTRQVTLTPDGAAYYDQAVRLLGEIDELEATMVGAKASPKGRLRIDVVGWVGQLLLVPAMPDFHQRYPDIQVEVGVTDRPVDLLTENIDCAIRGGDIDNESLVARKIAEFRFIAVASPDYLRCHGTPVHPAELETPQHRVVGFFSTRTGRTRPLFFQNDSEAIQVNGEHALAVNDTNAYVAAGVAGMGVITAPRFILHDALVSGRLVQILPGWTSGPVPMHIVWAPNRHLSAKLRVFVDWLVNLFEEHPSLQSK